jgi:hypothetical protein
MIILKIPAKSKIDTCRGSVYPIMMILTTLAKMAFKVVS